MTDSASSNPLRPLRPLRLGRIDYVNVLPLFHALESADPEASGLRIVRGHPSEINRMLEAGQIDAAPASAFEYLVRAERYELLPDLAISCVGPVQSVLCLLPFSREELGVYSRSPGAKVGLTSASASSSALLKILWTFAWKLPEPTWIEIAPGAGLPDFPVLDIGDSALRRRLAPPSGWTILDLGEEWNQFTGLPFVFALWFVRRDLDDSLRSRLGAVRDHLLLAAARLPDILVELANSPDLPGWLTGEALADYFTAVRYALGPQEKAGLMLYADYCRRLGLIPGAPALRFVE